MIPPNNDMRFEVTTKCDFRCVICPRDLLTRKKETMSLETFKMLFDRIVAETDQYTTLSFPGMGEPLLDDGLHEKIIYAKKVKSDLEVLILSNGSRLSAEKFSRLQDAGVSSIRVSLYGNDPESYCRVHGVKDQSMFQRVRDNILHAVQAGTTTKMLLTFNMIEGYNDHIVEDWIEFWKDKVELVEVWRPHNWGDSKHYRNVQPKKIKTCGRPFTGPLQIQVDGTINMCCFDFDGKLTIGDLKTQSLEEIFSSPEYRKIAQCHTSGDFEGSDLICADCDQRNADKSDVMIYDSKFDIEQRVKMTSTTYTKVIE